MRPTYQHLCLYAVPLLLVQWKDKFYKGQPLHLCPRSHPLSYSVILLKQNALLSLSYHQISSVWEIFPIRANLPIPLLPSPFKQTHKTSLDQISTSSYYTISLLQLITKLIKRVVSLSKYSSPIFPESSLNKPGLAFQ